GCALDDRSGAGLAREEPGRIGIAGGHGYRDAWLHLKEFLTSNHNSDQACRQRFGGATMKARFIFLTILLLVGAGIIAFVARTRMQQHRTSAVTDTHNDGQLWTCSMHPQVIQDKPGQCPICPMEL